MNICFLIGKIISDVKFDFVIGNNKYFKNGKISVVRFKVELLDGNVENVIAYNKKAEECYRKLEKGGLVNILGELDTKMEVEIKEFEKFCEFKKFLVKVT